MAREFKDSGIEWIGQIPKEWEVIPLKWVIRAPLQYGANETGLLYKGDLPRYVRITDIINNNLREDIQKQSLTEEQAEGYILEDKDILFARSGATVGKAFIYKNKYGRCAYAGYLIRAQLSSNYCPEFVYYYTQSHAYEEWKKQIFIQATIQNIGADRYSMLEIPFPSISEQQKIADYLDKVCGEIDEMVALQETMIEELKAYKQSVITEAVTKGLNPNVPMRNSGIDWIGNIPTHWQMKRLKFMCEIQTGNQDTQDAEQDGEYPFYVRSPKVEHSNKYSFEGEGILMAGDGAGAGRVFHHAFGKYAVHQRVYRLSSFDDIDTTFLFHYISNLFCKVMDMGSAQSTVPSVRLPMLQNFVVCIPSIEEQQHIATYLDTQCSEIDSLIALKQTKIEELKEYKKSVIYEYVTGKKEVV